MSASEIIVLGRLVEPYGVRGWLHLQVYGDDPLSWKSLPVWQVGKESGSWQVGKESGSWQGYELQGLKAHGDGFVVAFAGVADRTAAEAMKGMLVGAPRAALPAVPEDEFYWADLVGLDVVNRTSESLGKVVGLIETGANAVLRVVDTDAAEPVERLLPFVAAVVGKVDVAAGVVHVDWERDW